MIVGNVTEKQYWHPKFAKNAKTTIEVNMNYQRRYMSGKGIRNRGTQRHRDKSKYHRPSIETIVVEDDDLGRFSPDFQTFQEERDWNDWEPNSWGY
tara:strand:+ start:1258 stop:1545 length:288 start_codon:yes stop_codon:yes gene_type:complete